jgi:transcriptional regulator with XRE-family HTH domain
MGSRELPSTAARRRIADDKQEVIKDLRSTRIELGLSQAEVARSAGISADQVSRIERNLLDLPAIDQLAAHAAVLGMRLRLSLYAEGEPLRDGVQIPGLTAFRRRLHPSLAWRTEVVLPGRGDRRAWDAVVIDDDRTWTAIEWVSRIGAVDALLRRTNQKQRDDARIGRVVLVVADTVRNRHALATAIALIRAEYPLGTREVLGSLERGHAPALNGVALVRVPRDRPQPVHNGGKVVDAAAPPPPRFVENPVGRSFIGP